MRGALTQSGAWRAAVLVLRVLAWMAVSLAYILVCFGCAVVGLIPVSVLLAVWLLVCLITRAGLLWASIPFALLALLALFGLFNLAGILAGVSVLGSF